MRNFAAICSEVIWGSTMQGLQSYIFSLTAVLSFTSLGCYFVQGARVRTSDVSGLAGDNCPSVKCEFMLEPGDSIETLTIRKSTDEGFKRVADFYYSATDSIYRDKSLENRTTLQRSNDSASIIFNFLRLADEGTYECDLYYQDKHITYRAKEIMRLVVKDPSELRTDLATVRLMSDKSATIHMMSLGIGISIGVCFMLLVTAVCLIMVYCFRKKVADRLRGSGENGPRRSNARARQNMRFHNGNQEAVSDTETERMYAELTQRHEYDRLENETRHNPVSYDRMRTDTNS